MNSIAHVSIERKDAAPYIPMSKDRGFTAHVIMCKEETALPDIKGGTLLIKNKKYYLKISDGENTQERELCRVTKENRQFIQFIAESELQMIERQKEIEEIEKWQANDIT